jgi:hypothetical protein
MQKFKWLSTFEGTLLALIPALAVLIAYLYQVGCYIFLSVPFELVELNTPKIIVSIIALVFFFWFYGVVWVDNYSLAQPKKWYGLLLWHLFINSIMTGFFWFRPRSRLSSNLVTLAICLVLFTAGTLWLHRLLSSRARAKSASLLEYSAFVAYAIAIVFFVSVGAGISSEAKQTSRLALRSSNLIFVGTYNGQYILKQFDPKTRTIFKNGTILMPPEKLMILERRKIELKSQGDL